MQPQKGAPIFPKLTEIYLSLFGLVPWYSFKKGRLVLPRVLKTYVGVLSIAMVTISLSLIFAKLEHVMHEDTKLLVTVDIFADVGSIISFVVTMRSLSNGRLWEDLYKRIANTAKVTNSTSPNTNIILVIGNSFLLVLMAVDIIESNATIAWHFLARFISRIFSFVLAYLIFHVILTVKYKYVAVRRLLRFTPDEVLSGRVFPRMKQLKKLYLNMEDLTQTFNALFGWSVLLLIFNMVLQMQCFLTIMISDHVVWDGTQYKINAIERVILGLYILEILIWLIAIIFCCDSVVREADELLTNCYRLEQTLPLLSKELEELENLKKLIKNKSPKLTAAGFFEIRRSTLLSLLSTTTTYFIVALQFNAL